MSTTKRTVSNDNDTPVTKPKTCFVIMPIADHPDYETGHFDRVYEYLIKPACIKAGYEPRRADDNKASNMIMFDILKKIMECDMAICDLSSKNANVFYELGLRQAFNKKTILITDGRENAPFDIAAFRYVRYSASLRIDTVINDTSAIIEMLEETENAPEDDVNSIVKLLKIQPAHVEKLQLSQQESVFFEMFKSVDNKLNILSNSVNHLNKKNGASSMYRALSSFGENKITLQDVMKHDAKNIHNHVYRNWDGVIGRYLGTNESGDMVFKNGDKQFTYPNIDLSWENIFIA
ncbi:hypothetical protein JEM52_13270 [Citrobacter koseri]|uniref:hypothetical protein n=1 Tax=Citrobacter koseri TaxID=545 RepID=UPI001F1F08AB|nr:hypothetical protein [Citrobacter koseri]MCE5350935.1 hypothetical protein [Citrobacter koseri]